VIQHLEGVVSLEGPVTLETTPALLTSLKPLIASELKEVTFRGVEEVDSAALGLILACRREAERHGRVIKFIDLPANLLALATLYGVSDLIPQ
jgi:phospholipid transport system transporter-binding protein